MRKPAVFVLLTIFLIQAAGLSSPQSAKAEKGVLVVKVKSHEQALADYGEAELLFGNTYRLTVGNIEFALRDLSSAFWVEYVQEDAVLKTTLTVSDPLFVLDRRELTKQWYLPKLEVQRAWEINKGAALPVAIVDTGINGRHEDLADGRVIKGYASYCQVPNLASPNQCLVRVSGDLAANINSDDNGHGTIVAGIIGAITNNNKGVAGINWNVRLMPIKALDSQGSGFASDVALGMRWAADNGAKIINLSIGGPGLEGIEVLEEAISYAFNKGILIVAAAGNDAAVTGGNLNTSPVLPVCADGGQNMILGVAAVDIDDKKARFSNYGSNCIDIVAPGTGSFVDKQNKQGLVSTYYDPSRPGENDLYVYALGTSVAAPMVSGVAALMMSAFPDLDARAIRDRLISSVDNIDEINATGCNGQSCTGHLGRGRLNALKALTSQATLQSGSLVRSPEGQLFLIERGLKRPISEFVFNQRFAGTVLTTTAPGQLDSFPRGEPVPPPDGTLVKEPTVPTVYVLEGGKLQALSLPAFVSRRLRFENVVTLAASELVSYAKDIDAPVLHGVLLKSRDHPAVFISSGEMRHLLSFFVFVQRGFNQQPIAEVSAEELSRYPLNPRGFIYPPLDGTLIRGQISPTVYLAEGGKLRALNLPAFQNRNFRFESVKVVAQSELESYEIGNAIVE